MKKTCAEIIDETIEFYQKNPRSISKTTRDCLYNGPNGAKCAFSRLLEDSEGLWEGRNAYQTMHTNPNLKFKLGYEGKSSEFYTALQKLHDLSDYWSTDEQGNNILTSKGRQAVQEVKELFKDQ